MVQMRSGYHTESVVGGLVIRGRYLLGTAVLAGLAVTLSVGEALADARSESVAQRIRPEYDPLGLPMDMLFWESGRLFSPDSSPPREGQTALGSFLVFPSLNTSLTFEDNVYRDETNENSDFIFRVTPLIRFESDWDNHYLALEGGLEYGKYFSLSSEDYLDALLGLDGRVDVTEDLSFDGRLEWRNGHEGRGDADDAGANFDITEFQRYGGRIGGQFANELVPVSFGYEYFVLDYDDASGPGGTINNQDRNYTDQRAFIRFSTIIDEAEGISAFIQPALNWVSYDQTPDDDGFLRDNNGYSVIAGIEWDPDEVWELRAGVGYQYQTYDDPRFDEISGLTFTGNVLWNVDELTTVELGFNRTLDQTTQADSAGKLNDQFSVQVDHELQANWILAGYALYRMEDFSGIDRDDDIIGGGLSSDYYYGENVVFGAAYNYERRDTDLANESYSVNSFMLNVLLRM